MVKLIFGIVLFICFHSCLTDNCTSDGNDLIEELNGVKIINHNTTHPPLALNISCIVKECNHIHCSVHGEINSTERTLEASIFLPKCSTSESTILSMAGQNVTLTKDFQTLFQRKELTIKSKMVRSQTDSFDWSTRISFKVSNKTQLDYDLIFKNLKACIGKSNPTTAHTTKTVTTTPSVTSKKSQTTTKLTTQHHTSSTTTTTTTTTQSTTTATTQSKTTNTKEQDKSNTKSKPPIGKIVLLVLAIVILISVVSVAIYCRRKKRLSNQPAYYNDIAINDPLRDELYDQAEYTEDDDELPLFT